jgi:diguanylate cyclase (GGDEF)-like protein
MTEMALDQPTLLLVQASIAVLTTVLVVVAALAVGRRADLLWWAGGNVVATLGLAIASRHGWPSLLHAVLSHALMAYGLALVWRGLHLFVGRDGLRGVAEAIGVAALAVAALYTYVLPSLNARLIANSLGFALINLLCAATLLRGARVAGRSTTWVAAVGFVALALALLGRAVLLAGPGEDAVLQRSLVTTTLLVVALAQVAIAFGMVLMVAEQSVAALRAASVTDRLTGALNRAGLEERAQQLLDRARLQGRGVALLMLDVDHFKNINDAHGHPAGDAVLRALVDRLLAEVRQGDLVTRWGGEEFLLLLDGLDGAAAVAAAERLRAAVARTPVPAGGTAIPVTASIGLASSTQAGWELDALLRRADAAVYRAKAAGRNCVVVDG